VKLFVDASAFVAILNREAERFSFVQQIDQADAISSALATWETASAFVRLGNDVEPDQALSLVRELMSEYKINTVPIGLEEGRIAVEAFSRYGKGRHPARLNMGDCFAYACAKTNNARLLYKGDDFAHTDLA
jgi:ribonuclease VapC